MTGSPTNKRAPARRRQPDAGSPPARKPPGGKPADGPGELHLDRLPDLVTPPEEISGFPEIRVAIPEDDLVVSRSGSDGEALGTTTTGRAGRRRRPRVRRVTRVIRHVDAWSVLKISAVFFVTMYLILLVAGVLLWTVAVSTGTVHNVERFIRDLFALDTFAFSGGAIFHASWITGMFLVIGGIGFTVTLAVLFNLISDLVGGLRVTVLEEEVVATELIDDGSGGPGIV